MALGVKPKRKLAVNRMVTIPKEKRAMKRKGVVKKIENGKSKIAKSRERSKQSKGKTGKSCKVVIKCGQKEGKKGSS